MYHSLFPNSQKEVYTANENIDFNLGNVGRAIVPGSLRLTGKIRFLVDGVRADGTDDIKYDSKSGIHGFWDNLNTSFERSGNIEALQGYGRYIHMKNESNNRDIDAMCKVKLMTALNAGDDEQTKFIAAGIRVDGVAEDQSFSMTPDFVLNNASAPINYSKTGVVMFSIRTNPNQDVLFGTAVNMTYEIRDLQLQYKTTEEIQGKVVMVKKVMLKNTINSTNQLLQNYVPLDITESVAVSFIQTAHLSNVGFNQYATEKLPSVTDVEFNLNHNNAFIAYVYNNPEEVQMNYLNAISNRPYNENSLDKLQKGVGYGIGHKLPSVNLSQRKLGIRIQSQASNIAPYSVFSYYQGVIAM